MKTLKFLVQAEVFLKTTYNETAELFKNGFAEEMDVDQLQLTLADLDSRIKYAEQQAKIAEDMLKFQMGLDLRTEITLTDNVESLTAGDEIGSMLMTPFSISNNFDYRIQSSNVALAELGIKMKKHVHCLL